jgi:DNA-binding CsgD family transcriptional regulator
MKHDRHFFGARTPTSERAGEENEIHEVSAAATHGKRLADSRDRTRDSCVPEIIMGRSAPGRTHRDPRTELVEVWRSILHGRCRVIERFEARRRRYFVVVVCQPGETHPRGLSKWEAEVVPYAIRGETHKRIGYKLGLSRSSVTKLPGSALNKLYVRTQAQLVSQFSYFSQRAQAHQPNSQAASVALAARSKAGAKS